LILSDVLYVSDFQFNILLVSKLCRQIFRKVISTLMECTFWGLMLQEVLRDKSRDDLCHAQHSSIYKEVAQSGSLVMQSGSKQDFKTNSSISYFSIRYLFFKTDSCILH